MDNHDMQAVTRELNAAVTILESIDATIPDELREAAALEGVLQGRWKEFEAGAPNLRELTLSALKEGRDPYQDPHITRASIRQTVTANSPRIADYAASEGHRVARAHFEEVADILDKIARTSATALARADKQLDGADPHDAAAIAHTGYKAVRAWEEGRAAAERLHHVFEAWTHLKAAAFGMFVPAAEPYVLAIPNLEAVAHDRRPDTWDAWIGVRLGDTFKVASSPTEAESRREFVNTERRARDKARKARTTPRGFGNFTVDESDVTYSGADGTERTVAYRA